MKRLFLDYGIDNIETKVCITGDDAHHLLYATRVRKGETFMLVDNAQKVFKAEVAECTATEVFFTLLEEVEDGNTEAPIEVVLAQCLLKGDKMDFVVQKAVELGLQSVVPVMSQNCVVKLDAKKQQARQVKWQKVADEAAKQCGRTMKAEVETCTSFSELLKSYEDYCKVLCYEDENTLAMGTALSKFGKEKYLLLIGPEGGFSPEEHKLCVEAGFHSVSLGPRILRAETAALAAMTITMFAKGDLGSE